MQRWIQIVRIAGIGPVVISGLLSLIAPEAGIAAPNTGSGPQKTDKQCKDERAKCLKDCDQLIDIDNNIQRCKDRCTDDYIICTPLRQNMPGGRFGGMQAPAYPRNNAPIMRRGVEEEPSRPPEGQGK